MDCESCCSWKAEADPARRRDQRLLIFEEILRRLGSREEAGSPGFGDELWAHFNRLPTRYMMDVNVEKTEEVLLHKCLLHKAADSANGFAFHVDLLQVSQADDSLDCPSPGHVVKSCSTSLSGGRIHPPPVFGSSSSIEALGLEADGACAQDSDCSANDSNNFLRNIHEITFAACNKPKLLSQLTFLLSALGLNIQEAHAFNTNDGYALDVFVVDGWPYKESERLRHAIQTGVHKSGNKFLPKSHLLPPKIQDSHTRDEPKLDHVQIPSDGNDEWHVDVKLLQFGHKLESRSYGDMYTGIYCNQDVTIKVLNLENVTIDRQKEFAQEVYIMRKVRHKNIVQFIGTCTQAPNMFIVTGSLHDFLQKEKGEFKLPFLLRVALDVSKGMNYLHQCNIIHRDLKSANLFMNENGVVKVSDFGVARVSAQSGLMTSETGTYRWMAPEVIEHRPYSQKADVFSFGIVLWELLTGKQPYENLTPLEVALGVVQKGLRPSIPEGTHGKLVMLMERCWHQDPNLRPDFCEILENLRVIARKVGDEKVGGGFLSSLLRGH